MCLFELLVTKGHKTLPGLRAAERGLGQNVLRPQGERGLISLNDSRYVGLIA